MMSLRRIKEIFYVNVLISNYSLLKQITLVFPWNGGSTVWFCQNGGILLTLDSLVDCAMIKYYFVVANSKLKLLKRIRIKMN